MTNVPQATISSRGVTVPTEQQILTGVFADFNAAFGGNLSTNLETPQGQLASTFTQIIGAANSFWVWLVNQIDPETASGTMQDAIGKIYGMTRKPATPTLVTCTVTGLSGTSIPVGSQAIDTNGNVYVAIDAITIPVGGTTTGTFANIVYGPIACPANTLNKIYQKIVGWDTINNPADGALGSAVESRAEFEYRRKNTVDIASNGSLSSIYSALFNVPDVVDVFVAENNTGATVNIGSTSYPLVAHSFVASVRGGTSSEIGAALFEKKAPGSNMNGNTTVNVVDSTTGRTYAMKFERPADLAIKFAVSIVNDSALPSDIVALIQNAIINAFSGLDGGSKVRIGTSVYASRYYAPVAATSPLLSVIEILVGTSTATLTSVAVGIDQFPTITASNITVTLV